MENKKIILHIILTTVIVIIVSILSVAVTKFYLSIRDKDYQKLGLEIEDYKIEYYTVYEEDCLGGNYKVYKIKNYYKDSMDAFENQLKASDVWNQKKYYEYIMKEFYEIKDGKEIYVDRENLFYYHGKGAYAIFDLKNAKLYYFENRINNHHVDDSCILEININNYINREIYSVRGGLQFDGNDYYVYNFDEEKGKEIEESLNKSQIWTKEKLENEILESFEYNSEVLNIENGYYHYNLVCRTRDENKKKNITEENATGYEIGVYDADKNILYYYWESI